MWKLFKKDNDEYDDDIDETIDDINNDQKVGLKNINASNNYSNFNQNSQSLNGTFYNNQTNQPLNKNPYIFNQNPEFSNNSNQNNQSLNNNFYRNGQNPQSLNNNSNQNNQYIENQNDPQFLNNNFYSNDQNHQYLNNNLNQNDQYQNNDFYKNNQSPQFQTDNYYNKNNSNYEYIENQNSELKNNNSFEHNQNTKDFQNREFSQKDDYSINGSNYSNNFPNENLSNFDVNSNKRFEDGKLILDSAEPMHPFFNTNGNIYYEEKPKNDTERGLYFDATKEPLYKIRNLGFEGNSKNKYYSKTTLYDINFDIFSGDRIVLLSTDGILENLFIDILKNNEKKSEGYIFVCKRNSSIWQDAYENVEPNIEYKNININNLLDINYELIVSFKNNLDHILNKIISKFNLQIDSETLSKFIDFFCFYDKKNISFFDLSISEQNRFVLMCDILIGKRFIYVNNVSLDLNIREKIYLFRFLSNYLTNRDNVLIVLSNDITEIKILCNRAIVFSKGVKKEDKYFGDILKYYESIDDFVILNLK